MELENYRESQAHAKTNVIGTRLTHKTIYGSLWTGRWVWWPKSETVIGPLWEFDPEKRLMVEYPKASWTRTYWLCVGWAVTKPIDV